MVKPQEISRCQDTDEPPIASDEEERKTKDSTTLGEIRRNSFITSNFKFSAYQNGLEFLKLSQEGQKVAI